MRRILIKVSYKGTNFKGMQIQNSKKENVRTVQGVLEEVLTKFLGEKILLFPSSRTDAGVHARGQTIHFDTNSDFDFKRLPLALIKLLPSDLSVISAEEIDSKFHARYSATQKEYHYMCYASPTVSPLIDDIALRINKMPNIKNLKKAMQYFVGTHDYTSFISTKKNPKVLKDIEGDNVEYDEVFIRRHTNIRTIQSFKLDVKDNLLTFKIVGNGFLQHMIRIIVGTLLDVGEGKIMPEHIEFIMNKRNRNFAGETAKPKGLMLYDVKYD